MTYLPDLFANIYFWATFSGVVAFLVSIRMYPVIIYTVRAKNLMDEPGERKIHATKIPTLGGVGLFAAFALSLILFGLSVGLERPDLLKLLSLLAATMILLFLGMKDDLIAMSPKKKFIGQLIASAIIIFMTDVRVLGFNGLLGIGELPYAVSVLFTLFVFILVINSFNMIDGIDGLAGAIATISSVAFGIFFLLNENYLLVLVSCILIGALLGFLRYNLSESRKLFMGDSGSLFLGFLLAYQGISFLVLNESETASFTITNAPILLLAILSFPLLDTLRVFAIRAKEKRSPFSPDRNHMHHRLLDLGLTHKQATLTLAVCNVLIIGLALVVRDLNINAQLVICVSLGSMLYFIPFLTIFEKGAAVHMKSSVEEEKNMRIAVENYELAQKIVQSQKAPIEPVVFVRATASIKVLVNEESDKKVNSFR
ncbi:MAG: MraY family glycosyltransferase, partial [Maribacter sp.]